MMRTVNVEETIKEKKEKKGHYQVKENEAQSPKMKKGGEIKN